MGFFVKQWFQKKCQSNLPIYQFPIYQFTNFHPYPWLFLFQYNKLYNIFVADLDNELISYQLRLGLLSSWFPYYNSYFWMVPYQYKWHNWHFLRHTGDNWFFYSTHWVLWNFVIVLQTFCTKEYAYLHLKQYLQVEDFISL